MTRNALKSALARLLLAAKPPVHFADGSVRKGCYVDGKRHGQWTERGADGGGAEGPYVAGKRDGWWTQRSAHGTVWVGPYVDDKRHGQWSVRFAEGRGKRLEFRDGKRIK